MRFALGQSGDKPMLILGLNPSTATEIKSDLTLSKVRHILLSQGFDGFVLLNLCPIRSTHISKLPHRIPDRCHEENLAIIDQCALEHIWAAWGTAITARRYFVPALREIINCLDRSGAHWFRYGTLTKGGHPRHVSYGESFYFFDVREYLDRLNGVYKD